MGFSLVWKTAQQPNEVCIVNPEMQTPASGRLPITSVQLLPIARASGKTDVDQEPVIQREVTVFTFVPHATGAVITGWNYKDGAGGKPTKQFCYFSSPNADRTKTLVDLAVDRKQLPSISEAIVPNVDDALSKCQWFED